MPTTSKLHPSISVLRISELLSIICDLLEPYECVPLLKTSQICFPIAASRIWERVDNARILLELIGTNSLRARGSRYRDFKNEAVMSLYSDSDFRRFDTYAPFVKYLDVYGPDGKHFKVIEWNTIFKRARQKPLLPNLLSLTIHAANSRFAVDQMLWISAFASPSLLHFTPTHIRDSNKALISDLAVSIILKTLKDRSPNIQSLSLYPQRPNGIGETDGESCLLNMMWPGPFLPYVQSLVNLRTLSTSLHLIDGSGLLVLGSLPQLETLTIRGCNDYLDEDKFDIPDDSFPQLTHLTLGEIYIWTVAQLMGVVPLTKNLIFLSICQYFEEQDNEEQEHWYETTVSSILQHTPRLKRFHYDATYNLHQLQLFHGSISQNLIQRISDLELETLLLVGFHFTNIEALENMSVAWSTLTSLQLTHAVIKPEELIYFSKLFALQFLTLVLPLGKNVQWPVFDGTTNPSVALRTIMNSGGDAQLEMGIDADVIVRSLRSLWPKLGLVRWPAAEDADISTSSLLFISEVNHLLNSPNELVIPQGEAVEMAQAQG